MTVGAHNRPHRLCKPTMGRVNALHLVTANILGQHITYIPSQAVDPEEPTPSLFRVTRKTVKDALETLLDAV